jgi:hypothetical protein
VTRERDAAHASPNQLSNTGEVPALALEDTHKLIFEDMIQEVVAFLKDKGWYEDGRSVGDEIALLHSECSEALEEFRAGRMKTCYEVRNMAGDLIAYSDEPAEDNGTLRKPVGFASELADVLIRLLDDADRHKVDLVAEFRIKMAYNRTRPVRHGGKAI